MAGQFCFEIYRPLQDGLNFDPFNQAGPICGNSDWNKVHFFAFPKKSEVWVASFLKFVFWKLCLLAVLKSVRYYGCRMYYSML